MSQFSDSQDFIDSQLYRFFQSTASDHAHASSSYAKALASFTSFISLSDARFTFPSLPLLADWLVHMHLHKLSFKTSLHYLNAMSALWTAAVKQSLATPSDAFRQAKSRLADIKTPGHTLNAADFSRVKDFLHRLPLGPSSDAVAADMLLFSLLTAETDPAAVASLKKDILPSLPRDAAEVAARNISPLRKYIFDLRQSPLTPRQLERKATAALASLIRMRNLPGCDTPRQTIAAWWAFAALRAGISGPDVVALLGFVPDANPHLALSDPSELTPGQRSRIIETVSHAFSHNPLRWFAMRLRPRVSFDDLNERIGQLDPAMAPQLFYPLQEIARRVKKKIIFEQKPLIPDVVFFRYRASDIPLLFSSLYELAWCYTTSGKIGAPYAPISDAAFTRFRHAIGHFSSRCENELADIPRGTDIKIVAGLFEGLQSELDKIENEDGENIFRLLYQSPNGIRWNIGVDPRNAKVAANHAN